MVASILRCATTCWCMGNFNSAMQILAGLKYVLRRISFRETFFHWFRIEAFRPLWLTITDEFPGFKFLTDAFNSNEKTPQYCDAVSRALDIPTCKVVPFFGTFLKDLRTILSSVPSIVVLCNRSTQKPIEVCQWSIDRFNRWIFIISSRMLRSLKIKNSFSHVRSKDCPRDENEIIHGF